LYSAGTGPSSPPLSPQTPLTPRNLKRDNLKRDNLKYNRGCVGATGYYKHLVGSARAIISELRLDESYKRAVLGMIARTIDGKVIHRDEFLGRLSSLRSEIEARAQRESRSDLCYWLKRRLFPQKRVCARCKAETDGLIEGLCSRCYREVAHEDARTCRCGAAL
jgi:hypothetical protein